MDLYHEKTKAVVRNIPELSAHVYKKSGWTEKIPKTRQEDEGLNVARHEAPEEEGR